MKKGVVIAGLAIILISLILLITFPYQFYKSAGEVNSSDYSQGTKITVYGTITDVKYINLENMGIPVNMTIIELDSHLNITLEGKLRNFGVGSFVIMDIIKSERKVQVGPFQFVITYWETSQDSIHSVEEIQRYFEIAMIVGAVVLIVGMALRF